MSYVICSLLSMIFGGSVVWRYKDDIRELVERLK